MKSTVGVGSTCRVAVAGAGRGVGPLRWNMLAAAWAVGRKSGSPIRNAISVLSEGGHPILRRSPARHRTAGSTSAPVDNSTRETANAAMSASGRAGEPGGNRPGL